MKIMSNQAAKKAYQLGRRYEMAYKGCSQCVLAALQDTFKVRDDNVFKAATGFAAGGGLCGDGSCGAYAGAIMMLSSLAGRPRDDFEDRAGASSKTFGLVQQLRQRFVQEFGSVACRDIQYRVFGRPYYLLDMDDDKKFDAAGGHTDKCPDVVGKAAQWAAEIIIEEGLVKA
jgi:C_GCAxxG_C_C family probable redox protein